MASRRNPSPSPSISSLLSDVASELSPGESDIRNLVKKLLVKRLFIGQYQERRHVASLGIYRDLVVLHESESELQVDLDRARSKLSSFYGAGKWIGITSPDLIGVPAAGHCLWTKLRDVAFGFFWFQIRQICIEEREVFVRLKVIRPVCAIAVHPPVASASFVASLADNVDILKARLQSSIHSLTESQSSKVSAKPLHDGNETDKKPTGSPRVTEDNEKISSVPDSTTDDCNQKIKQKTLKFQDVLALLGLIFYNLREIITFLSVAFVGTLGRLGRCVEWVGDFSLKFIREVTIVLEKVTPIILGVIELVGKVIGGLYILLAMIFKKSDGPPGHPGQFPPAVQNRGALPPATWNRRALPPPEQNRRPPSAAEMRSDRYANYRTRNLPPGHFYE
ncbi:hypothetical protein ONE63_000990 [Megalurothrips usitatus]|uniref:Uncharacterized protein n=1 Tax=Megalurothrips usitatus TaxID=439358 RepID=A0AAV7Y084_9NEOP|nr:hypothetical protein ONE63_000990 [Megalurothrips usitatus]